MAYVYWSAVDYVSDRSDSNVEIECSLLIQTFNRFGRGGVADLIARRVSDPFFSEWRYLLADASLRHIAGNLKVWPGTLRSDRHWSNFIPQEWEQERTDERLLRASYHQLPDGSHLLVARKADDRKLLNKKIRISVVWAAAAFLILAAAAGISTSRRSVARIEEIIVTSRDIIRTGLRGRIPRRGTGDEWDALAENLNFMLDRIEDLVVAGQQISDNVAHDLRTPLTRIRGRLERAYTQQLGIDQYRALIGDVITQLDEVLRVFSSLLRIAQIERRDRTAGFRSIDLTEIACEVLELFDPAAEANGVTLRLTRDDPVNLVGDRDLLFDAVSNLVDNAIKHGGRGEVTVTLANRADASLLSVADHGPGIPVDERNQVLRRFHRLERSRNSPGNGLGLSLVAAVASLHGACLNMVDNLPGLRIELRFPVVKSCSQRFAPIDPPRARADLGTEPGIY